MTDAAWVALSLIGSIGGVTMRALSAEFNGDLAAACRADRSRLQQVRGIGPKLSHAIGEVNIGAVEADMRRWQARGVQIITLNDSTYPALLRGQPDAPPTLFVMGTLPARFNAAAIIGTRSPSRYALSFTVQAASELAEQGRVIVSGLAHGIDTQAHMGALSVPDGQTIAVLGGGILNIYPPENRALAEAIMQRGALICESPPDASASAQRLVARNRIITGLCRDVIIVESSIEGGAMHAARFARAQGKRIHTLNLDASGNQSLIQSGVHVLSPDLPLKLTD